MPTCPMDRGLEERPGGWRWGLVGDMTAPPPPSSTKSTIIKGERVRRRAAPPCLSGGERMSTRHIRALFAANHRLMQEHRDIPVTVALSLLGVAICEPYRQQAIRGSQLEGWLNAKSAWSRRYSPRMMEIASARCFIFISQLHPWGHMMAASSGSIECQQANSPCQRSSPSWRCTRP